MTSDELHESVHWELATPTRRYAGWLIDCAFLFAVGPLCAFIIWGLLPVASPPAPPICDLECLDKNMRAALNPYASAEEIATGGSSLVLNSAAWLRHLVNLFLYALTLLLFLVAGLMAGAFVYIVWWCIALRRGQTPGKQLTGILTVRRDGTPADWATLFVREGLKTMLYLMPFGIVFDFFVTMSDIDRPYSLADRFTGTMVVRQRRQSMTNTFAPR